MILILFIICVQLQCVCSSLFSCREGGNFAVSIDRKPVLDLKQYVSLMPGVWTLGSLASGQSLETLDVK